MKLKKYDILKNNKITYKNFHLIPIRKSDILKIRRWRNDQMYILRQTIVLTVKDQLNYYNKNIKKSFYSKKPVVILFSFLLDQTCIGYGGLVHINWKDKSAEISFIMDTKQEKIFFNFHWTTFLTLVDQIAFRELNFHKIHTYAFDLRPKLYVVLEKCGYKKEKVLDKCYTHNDSLIDVVIHSKINK